MSAITKRLFGDPLLVKEFRTRLRARTVLIIELLYIIAVCGLVFLGFVFTKDLDEKPGWELGAGLFRTIVYVQAMLMLFVSPLISASAITGEKEQKTFDSLWVAPVSSRRVIWTKLAASFAFFAVLILVSVPFSSASFILGGVAPSEIAIAYWLTLLSTGAIGAVGLYWSTRFERSIAAIPAAAVCAVLAIVAVPPLADMGLKALACVSPAVYLSLLFVEGGVPFFGQMCPLWVPGTVFPALILVYFVTAASGRMKFPRERRYVLQRALTVLFFACLLLFVAGEAVDIRHVAKSPGGARSAVGHLMGILTAGLLVAAPWIGANVHVWRSELGAKARRSRFMRLISALLTRPWWFMLILAGMGAVCMLGMLLLLKKLNIPRSSVMLAYLGTVGLGALAWTMFSVRLSDRKTTKGRFIGMTVAYIAAAAISIGPFILMGISSVRIMGKLPAWIQYALLMSPGSGAMYASDPFDTGKTMSAVVDKFGMMGPCLITSVIYLIVFLVLMLPIYPSATRKMLAPPPPAKQPATPAQ